MKDKLKFYLELAEDILKEISPILIVIGLLSIQLFSFFATYHHWNTFSIFQAALIYSPWIIFLMSYCLDNNKHHRIWHNSNNIKLILISLDVYKYKTTSGLKKEEKYNPKVISEQYKIFSTFEKHKESHIAKYFLEDKDKTDLKTYRCAITDYSLVLFVKKYVLLSLCYDVILEKSDYVDFCKCDTADLLKLSVFHYGEVTNKCRYKLLYENNDICDSDVEQVFCNYIAFSVFNKLNKISFENMVLFGIDYFNYNKNNRAKEAFEKYYKEKIQSLEYNKIYTTGDYDTFMYYRPWCD